MSTDGILGDPDDWPEALDSPEGSLDSMPEWVENPNESGSTHPSGPDGMHDEPGRMPFETAPRLIGPGAFLDGEVIAGRGDFPASSALFQARFRRAHLHDRGGIGRVWWATDRHLGREVALKELRPDLASYSLIRDRFLREARITAQLTHPGIVPILDMDEGDESHAPAYVMRFVAGRQLGEAALANHAERAAGRADPLELRRLLQAFICVCETIAYAHARGVVHRDLKGSNIVLGAFGEVVVLDWGLAKLLDEPDPETGNNGVVPPLDLDDTEPDCTRPGQAIGTPGYAPPEQIRGQIDRVDRRSDVYGLGALLYEILTGRPPHVGQDRPELIRRICERDPVRPRALGRGIARPLEAICLKALARDPDDRYSSATELAAEVQHFLADEPVSAYSESVGSRLARFCRRHRMAFLSLFVLLLMAFAVLGTATWRIRLANREGRRNFRVARQTARNLIVRLNALELARVPGADQLRLSLAGDTKFSYQRYLQSRFVDPEVRFEAAEVFQSAGMLEQSMGLLDQALVDFRSADDQLARLQADSSDDEETRRLRAWVLAQVGETYQRLGHPGEAMASLRHALALARDDWSRDPGDDRRRRPLASALVTLMEIETEMDQRQRATAHAEEAVALLATLVEDVDPESVFPPDAYRFVLALRGLSRLHALAGRDDEADRDAARAVTTGRRLQSVGSRAYDPDLLDSLALALTEQARRESAHPLRRRDAGSLFDEAIGLLGRLIRKSPGMSAYQLDLADALRSRASWSFDAGRLDDARRDLERALAILQPLVNRYGYRAEYLGRLVQSHSDLGRLLDRLGQREEALAHFDRAARHKRLTDFGLPPAAPEVFTAGPDRDDAASRRIRQSLNARARGLTGGPAPEGPTAP